MYYNESVEKSGPSVDLNKVCVNRLLSFIKTLREALCFCHYWCCLAHLSFLINKQRNKNYCSLFIDFLMNIVKLDIDQAQ